MPDSIISIKYNTNNTNRSSTEIDDTQSIDRLPFVYKPFLYTYNILPSDIRYPIY